MNWQKVDNINQVIMTKIQANDVPDIAMIPQPGVVADIVKRNKATALDNVLDMNALKSSMLPGTLEAGTVNGKLYGLLVSANAKSFVWYPKKAWDAAGLQGPDDARRARRPHPEDQVRRQGPRPWCMGIESSAGDRLAGDRLVRGPGHALRRLRPVQPVGHAQDQVRLRPGAAGRGRVRQDPVHAGATCSAAARRSPSTNFGTAGNPMFDPKPGCMLYKQGSFITDVLPEERAGQPRLQRRRLLLPARARPAARSRSWVAATWPSCSRTTPAPATVMKLLCRQEHRREGHGGRASCRPHKDFDVSLYKGAIAQQIAKITYASSIFLFDGSDQMPGAVGAGTFWKDMTAWISGQETLDHGTEEHRRQLAGQQLRPAEAAGVGDASVAHPGVRRARRSVHAGRER